MPATEEIYRFIVALMVVKEAAQILEKVVVEVMTRLREFAMS